MGQSFNLTPAQEAELTRLKQYFPFRIVYAALVNGSIQSGAVTTMREPNRLARLGYTVAILK